MTTETPDDFPHPRRKDGGEPCGECHIQPDETCDICGAHRSATTAEPAVVVKALEWEKSGSKSRPSYDAKSVAGTYIIVTHGNHFGLMLPETGFDGFGYPFEGPLDKCKAAAQVDYETRIRSALAAPPPSPVVSETVKLLLEFAGMAGFPEFSHWKQAARDAAAALNAALSPAPAGEVGWREAFDEMLAAAEFAKSEMVRTIAPRSSFTDAVDALDAAVTKAQTLLPASPTGGDK